MEKQHLFLVYIFTLFGVQLIGPFESADVIGPQWLYLSLHSAVFLLIMSFNNINFRLNEGLLSGKTYPLLLLFYFFILLSIFQSNNIVESVYVIARLIIIPIEIYIFYSICPRLKSASLTISATVVTFLAYDLYLIYSEYFNITSGIVEYTSQYSRNLQANTGNKNIAAAAIMTKVPFSFYLLRKVKNIPIKSLLIIIQCLLSFALLLLSTRSMLLGLLLVIISFTVISIYLKDFKTPNILIIMSLLLPLVFGELYFSNEEKNFRVSSEMGTVINYDKSSSALERIRFYSAAKEQILKTPFLGIGIGNWKIKSIDYDSSSIREYIVPYNVHNDFLEMGVELGIFGMFSYIFIFIFGFLKYLKQIFFRRIDFFSLVTLMSLGVYFIDANLNFPMQRCIMVVLFITIFSIISIQEIEPKDEK